MKYKVGLLALLCVSGMAASAVAQVIIYEHRGKHHRLGIGISLDQPLSEVC